MKQGKIPTKMMDPIDQQQQEEIDSNRRLMWGLLFTNLVTLVIFMGAFVLAMKEMSNVIETLKMIIVK